MLWLMLTANSLVPSVDELMNNPRAKTPAARTWSGYRVQAEPVTTHAHIYMYTHTHTHTHTRINTHTHTHTHSFTHTPSMDGTIMYMHAPHTVYVHIYGRYMSGEHVLLQMQWNSPQEPHPRGA